MTSRVTGMARQLSLKLKKQDIDLAAIPPQLDRAGAVSPSLARPEPSSLPISSRANPASRGHAPPGVRSVFSPPRRPGVSQDILRRSLAFSDLAAKRNFALEQARSFSATVPRNDFYKDVGFGPSYGDIVELAAEHEFTTDIGLQEDDLSKEVFEKAKAALVEAHTKKFGRPPTDEELRMGMWSLMGMARRPNPKTDKVGILDKYGTESTSIVSYGRAVIDSSQNQADGVPGKIFFVLDDRWSARDYFLEALQEEIDHGDQPFAHFLVGPESPSPCRPRIVPYTTYTHLELGLVTEVELLKELPVQFYGQDKRPVDADQLRATLKAGVAATRTRENREAMKKWLKDATPKDNSLREFKRCCEARLRLSNYFTFDNAGCRVIADVQALVEQR